MFQLAPVSAVLLENKGVNNNFSLSVETAPAGLEYAERALERDHCLNASSSMYQRISLSGLLKQASFLSSSNLL